MKVRDGGFHVRTRHRYINPKGVTPTMSSKVDADLASWPRLRVRNNLLHYTTAPWLHCDAWSAARERYLAAGYGWTQSNPSSSEATTAAG